jgi:predicted nucleic acid-binding protein
LPALVADASAVINLIASGMARPIIESFPVRLRVVSAVAFELSTGTPRGWNSSEHLATLVASDNVEIVELDNCALDCFEALVVGAAADTLDDGEAATIAYARATGTVALIDEKKGRRICAERFPEVTIHTTVDLLTSDHITRMLGQVGVGDAVFNALNAGRMRVPAADYQRVVAIVGAERAKVCTSLPDHIRFPPPKARASK